MLAAGNARPWNAAALVIAALLATPLVVLSGNLLLPGGEAWRHLASTVLPDYVANTLALVVMVGVGTAIVGVSCAWLVTRFQFPGRRVLEWALLLPLAMPAYVMAYAYTDLLQFAGPVQGALRSAFGWEAGDYWFPEIRSLGGAGLLLVAALYPYVYLLARASFVSQTASLAEAGRTLGLTGWQSFTRVSLPLARPAIAAGVALACMETLADYGTVAYFGVPTFTTGILRAWISLGEPVSAAKLSLMLLAFAAVLIAAERHARRQARFHESGHARRRPLAVLTPRRAWLASAACTLPVLVGFLLPASLLGSLAIDVGDAQFGVRFVTLAANSLTLSAITALLAVLLAVVMAYGARLSRSRLAAAVNRFAMLGYAVPGAVIAVGVLIPASRLDHVLGDIAVRYTGVDPGLLLTGSIAALVYAYLIRFLAVALQSVESGLAKITPSMEDASRSLGMGPGATLRRVHLPLLRPSLVTAALLVFVDVMKELPATFMMRPFNFDTLAVQAYNLAADERLAEASTAALAIVAVGLVPLVIASRRLVRGESVST